MLAFETRIEQRAGDRRCLAAVHRSVVDLHDERHLAALEALHEHSLPQRPIAIETDTRKRTDKVAELAHSSWRGKRGVYEVVIQIESWVVDPMGIADFQWALDDAAPEGRDEMNPFSVHLASELEGRELTELSACFVLGFEN
jgi:hypothetical protein